MRKCKLIGKCLCGYKGLLGADLPDVYRGALAIGDLNPKLPRLLSGIRNGYSPSGTNAELKRFVVESVAEDPRTGGALLAEVQVAAVCVSAIRKEVDGGFFDAVKDHGFLSFVPCTLVSSFTNL